MFGLRLLSHHLFYYDFLSGTYSSDFSLVGVIILMLSALSSVLHPPSIAFYKHN